MERSVTGLVSSGMIQRVESMTASRTENVTFHACSAVLCRTVYDDTDPINRAPNAGSFIRPLPSIDYGRPFLDVLVGKYIEVQHGSATQETVVLGSSNGAIQVEAVNLDKIRGKFSRLERLRDISLDKEGVSRPNSAGEIRAKCPSEYKGSLSFALLIIITK